MEPVKERSTNRLGITQYGGLLEAHHTDDHLDYYGLFEEPFSITGTDHRFCYLSSQHRAAVDRCISIIQRHLGLGVIFGAVGSGKSTLCKLLYHRFLSIPEYSVALINDPSLAPAALLRTVLAEFKQPSVARQLEVLKNTFRSFVYNETQRSGKTVILLIDEAQTMRPATLELIRTLLNFEDGREKLLQVILFGQDELRAKIFRYRNIQNRIMGVATLEPLVLPDVDKLVRYRLFVAGREEPLFTPEAITGITRIAEGIPRTICAIANEALPLGAAKRLPVVDLHIIEEAAAGVMLQQAQRLKAPGGEAATGTLEAENSEHA